MNPNRFTHIAREIAELATEGKQFRHVSIVLSNKSIIAIGQNSYRTHTMAYKFGYKGNYVHSELDAFSKIKYMEGHFILINFRFNRNGELRNSRPCKHCLPWCMEFFDEIYFSTSDGFEKLR